MIRKSRMKPAILALIFLFFSCVPAFSSDHSFLWKIRSGSNQVYLMGSIHFLRKDAYPLKKEIEDAFTQSDCLGVEADMTGTELDRAQQLILQKAVFSEGTLKEHLSPGTYALLGKKLQESGMDISLFGSFKPWFIAMTISALELVRMGFDPDLGVDMHFLNRADARKIVSLESAEFQIDMLNNLSDSDQEAFLLYTLKDVDVTARETDRIVRAWSSGNAVEMESVLSGSLPDNPGLDRIYQKVLYDRNGAMASKIGDMLRNKEKCFVVVGAGHLVGKKGILELLKEKGFTVEQQ